jgi:hypothetical protein
MGGALTETAQLALARNANAEEAKQASVKEMPTDYLQV